MGAAARARSTLTSQVITRDHGHTAYGVVPDGVASVSLYYAKTASQNALKIIARATHKITVKVLNNMYVVNLGRWGQPAAVAYLSANGTVLRRFGTNLYPRMHLRPGATGEIYGF